MMSRIFLPGSLLKPTEIVVLWSVRMLGSKNAYQQKFLSINDTVIFIDDIKVENSWYVRVFTKHGIGLTYRSRLVQVR